MPTLRVRGRQRSNGGPGSTTDGLDSAAGEDAGAAIATASSDDVDRDGTGDAGGTDPASAPDQGTPLGQEVELTFLDGSDPPPADESREERLRRMRRENLAKGTASARARAREKRGTRPPPIEDEKPAKPAASKRSDFRLDKAAVSALLDIVDAMTAQSLGERAKFNDRERGLIEPSLARIIARMTPDAAAKFSQLADPLMLGTGLLLWGVRVFGNGPGADTRSTPPTLLRRPAGTVPPSPPPPTPDLAPNGVAPAPDHLADIWEAATP